MKCRRVNLRHRAIKETTKHVVPIEADLIAKAKKEDLIIPPDNSTKTETMETTKSREITKETDRITTIQDSAIINVMIITEPGRVNKVINNKKKFTTKKKKLKKTQMMNY